MAAMIFCVEIAVPRESVFQLAADFTHMAEHIDAVDAIDLLTEGPIGVGTKFKETRTMYGKQASEVMEVTAFSPPESFVLEAESCGCHYHSLYQFEAVENDETRLTLTMDPKPIAFAAKLMWPLFRLMSGPMRKAVQADLEQLKSSAERDAAAL